MKIKSIKPVGRRPVHDISVLDDEHYLLKNGVGSHNTGSYYASDNIYIIGRQQEKEGKDVVGYNFIINVEKSRFVQEKSKIPIEVTWERGVETWSGLLEIALDTGHVTKPSMGWYSRVDGETGEVEEKKWRAKDTYTSEFWKPVLKDKTFRDAIEKKFRVAHSEVIHDQEEGFDEHVTEE